MATVEGHSDSAFKALKDFFQEKLNDDSELGASINVNVNGKDVVDIWGGYADEEKSKPWKADTIVNVWSSTKTVTAAAFLLAHQRNIINLDDPVAKYWPEFAQNGKAKILIRHVLSHTSGVSGWEGGITLEELCDAPTAAAKLEAQPPWWEPGTASGYHATNQGAPLSEVFRRASGGHTLKDFIATEIAKPLNADFQYGALESDYPRIAPVIPPPPPPADFKIDPDSVAGKTFINPAMNALVANTDIWRQGEIGAVNGHTTALGLNRILRAITLAGTPHDEAKLFRPETISQIFREQSDGVDLCIGMPIRFGIGFSIGGGGSAKSFEYLPQEKMCFWNGWGGSFGVCDLQRGVTFTYVMNKMGGGLIGNERSIEYCRIIWRILKEGEAKL
jgi:CubicO group peptidase (beta-lactamase class C family)